MGSTPILRGVGRAFLAAVLFGLTAPVVQRESAGAGALACGSLLYFGAALASVVGLALRSRSDSEPRLDRAALPRLVVLALVGGAIAPALLVIGLQRIDAASGALLLALEAPVTVLLALVIHHEHLGRRVACATVLIFAGGLVLAGRPHEWIAITGGLFVVAASVAWALDNVLSRPLADRDPVSVVAGKALLGASASALVALSFRQVWPAAPHAVALLVTGTLGYGVSLQLYLRAQRMIGTARTASVFAAAPFLGAGTAFLISTPWPGWTFALAALLIGTGLWLHASEHHGHVHTHQATDHEHTHTHDDGHHDHVHEPMPVGPHSHPHRHAALAHEHEHGEDLHHRHSH